MNFKRIFVAINLSEKIKEKIWEEQEEIKAVFPEKTVKWVKKENLHITLAFFGNTSEQRLKEIEEILKKIRQDSFELKGGEICYGPKNNPLPRLIWIELEKSLPLLNIAKELANQKFFPHITLGRINTWQWRKIEPEERPIIEKSIDLKFRVNSIDIMESILRRSGPEYRILNKYNLKI